MVITDASSASQGGICACQEGGGMDSEGFSLLEVMIALFILFVGLLGTAAMQISAIRGNATANQMSEASVIASGRAEMLLSLDFDAAALVDGSETVDGYGVSWTVKAGAGGANTRDITVTVVWGQGDDAHSFDYRFLKVKNI